ncbi:MAG: dehydrogenase [Robiginitomaculum sp.]|nr:MAG: dehydrogenase [Robiginitomaculum sp.]
MNTSTTKQKDIDVIVAGAGHNGLVGACYLAKSGLNVLVLEAHSSVGGMTVTSPMTPEAPDHMINEASIHASLFRMSPIEAELELATKFGLRQRLIDPCHIQLAADKESSIGLWNDANKTAKEIEHFSPKDAKAWLELSELADAALTMGKPMAMTGAVKPSKRALMSAAIKTLPRLKYIKPLIDLTTSSQSEALETIFETDIVRAAIFTALPFMDPREDNSAFSLIYLAALQSTGVSMFEGGTGALPKALVRCLEHHGGVVRTNAKVDSFVMKDGAVLGVRLENGEEIMAPKGVMTAYSPKAVLNHTLPKGNLTNKMQKRAENIPTTRRGIADYKLNIALKGRINPTKAQKWRDNKGWDADLRVPTIQWVTYKDGIKAYRDCQLNKIPQSIPGLAQLTTGFDPTMAPDGCDTFWFWSGVTPVTPDVGWDVALKEITNTVIKESAEIYDGIESLEIARRPLGAPQIEKRFHAIDGSVYHVEPYVTRFGPGRPAKGFAGYETPIPGLFLSGSGTHPSAGICGLPGRNAAQKMIKVIKKKR